MKGCSSSLIRGIQNKHIMIIPILHIILYYYIDKDIENRHFHNMVGYKLPQPLWMYNLNHLSKFKCPLIYELYVWVRIFVPILPIKAKKLNKT